MAPELDSLRARIRDGYAAALGRPVLMALLPADAVRLLRAQQAYWSQTPDAELQRLYDLLPMFAQESKETDVAFQCPPQHKAACESAGVDVAAVAAEHGLTEAQVAAIDWSKFAALVKQYGPQIIQFVMPLILSLFAKLPTPTPTPGPNLTP